MQSAWTPDRTVLFQARYMFKGRVQFLNELGSRSSLGGLSCGIWDAFSHQNIRNFHYSEIPMIMPQKALCLYSGLKILHPSQYLLGSLWCSSCTESLLFHDLSGPVPTSAFLRVPSVWLTASLPPESSSLTTFYPPHSESPISLFFSRTLSSFYILRKSLLHSVYYGLSHQKVGSFGQGFLSVLFTVESQQLEKCPAQSRCPISMGWMNSMIIKIFSNYLTAVDSEFRSPAVWPWTNSSPLSLFSHLGSTLFQLTSQHCWDEQTKHCL